MINHYRELVLDANKKMNLVSRRSVDVVLDKLIEDSLIPLRWKICNLKSPVIDIGSGAGIPGLPLKIEKPELELYIVEANRRKSNFLKTVAIKLSLQKVVVLNMRAEDVCRDENYTNRFNTLLSRATASLTDLLNWGEELLLPGGELIAWKGSSVTEELVAVNSIYWHEPDLLNTNDGGYLVRLVKTDESRDVNNSLQ